MKALSVHGAFPIHLLVIVIMVCYGRPMSESTPPRHFNADEIQIIHQAVTMAEELVSDHYKMSATQWLRPKYDVKTFADLSPAEKVDGPFAQIIRYEGQRRGSTLGSEAYDFYKICLQDPAMLRTMHHHSELMLLPFGLYIVVHELVHIVRFSKFLVNFHASSSEKLLEEHRVHDITHQILTPVRLTGLDAVIDYYRNWRVPIERLRDI
jgi:hypothetical protein